MSILGKIIYSTFSSKEKIEEYQQIIRDEEWKYLVKEIPENSYFLDVGCGAGYAMQKAKEDKHCICKGIDPNPGDHGVGRYIKDRVKVEQIVQGVAENIPFDSEEFDVVFSSHVLEHVMSEKDTLIEIKRVLKNDGIFIIGVPTAMMSIINLFSNFLFTTHIKIYEFFRFFFTNKIGANFISIFRVKSHSSPRAASVWYDIFHYRIKNWKKIISSEFEIIKIIEPCLYPYPDYPQFFKLHKSKIGTSSVFFICKKK